MAPLVECLLLAILSLLAQAQAQNCVEQQNCSRCVKALSSSGACVWCPLTRTCHEPDSPQNICGFTQSILEQDICYEQLLLNQNYDPAVAYKMTMLSAVAYSDNASVYIDKALPQLKFQSVVQVSQDCILLENENGFQCSGFTAVSHVDKAVVLAFRGTEDIEQLLYVLKTYFKPMKPFSTGGLVQAYFYFAFYKVWSSLRAEVYNLTAKFPDYKVFVTGHSLGGALASLATASIVQDRAASSQNTILYTFGQPRVGDYDYAHKYDQLVETSWRVIHRGDIVVHLPPCQATIPGFTACQQTQAKPYHHGTEIFYPGGMSQGASYRECLGTPRDEDTSCSNGLCKHLECFSIKDHLTYFGVDVGNWWLHV